MNKTLAVIINHNRKEYTNQLYDSLAPYADAGKYDIWVLDNGTTDPAERSDHTTHETGQNCYYGGALNLIFSEFLNTDYEILTVLNNDVILHGYNYIENLRYQIEKNSYDVVSPCILQPERNQCYWRTMHNWGSTAVRTVRWIDFMAPMFSRRVVQTIGQFNNEMIFGWGQDVWTGAVCEKHSYKIGVVDSVSAIHMSAQTYKDGKSDITESEYGQKAMQGMYSYFTSMGMRDELDAMRLYARNYTFTPSSTL